MSAKPSYIPWLPILGLATCLAFGPAFGEAAKPIQKPVRAKPKIVDLDFSDDDDDPAAPRNRPKSGGSAGSGQWIYWTVGASVLAGGMGWYFLEERQKDPIVTRNEQVFTDERP